MIRAAAERGKNGGESGSTTESRHPWSVLVRVLTIDDHGMFRYGLRLTLEQHFGDVEVYEAGTISEGLELAKAKAPLDLALVDIIMPGEDGVEAIEQLKRLSPETIVAALSASEDTEDVSRVMAAGAMGFIKKSFGPEILKNVIELILSGERFFPVAESATSPDRRRRATTSRAATAGDGAVRFTPRQTEILRAVVDGQSNKEIARDLNIIEGTVKAHIRSMMGKLRVRNRTQLAIVATRLGLVDEPPEEGAAGGGVGSLH